jgi:hypothetical protein
VVVGNVVDNVKNSPIADTYELENFLHHHRILQAMRSFDTLAGKTRPCPVQKGARDHGRRRRREVKGGLMLQLDGYRCVFSPKCLQGFEHPGTTGSTDSP